MALLIRLRRPSTPRKAPPQAPPPARTPLFSATGFSRRLLAPIASLLLLSPPPASGFAVDPQTLPEYQIKAGFLFNFTRFVEWPQNSPPSSPLLVCVLDDAQMADLLASAASGKVVNGRPVSIRRTKPGDDLRACNVLFVSASDQRHAGHILESVKGSNVLTVGESPDFLKTGGMVNFYIQENRVKLDLNLDAATRSGLKVSAKLIAVSHLVSASGPGSF